MQSDFQPTVYLLANRKNGAIYTGVTSNLMRRIRQHREGRRQVVFSARWI
jgi:putative endonuclease